MTHTYRWTKQQAVQYMKDHTFMSDEGIDSEINRYITMPGQACSYKIGELHILNQIKYAKDALGLFIL